MTSNDRQQSMSSHLIDTLLHIEALFGIYTDKSIEDTALSCGCGGFEEQLTVSHQLQGLEAGIRALLNECINTVSNQPSQAC
ncbi:hypothetical protein SAMN02745119_00751 [Trichlorobacter thiogenes]|uniref:Uncharacterized protein n=1 Tax=Trichlorobacter thiogenes TaxID=115783 RepID=A0A1T4L416_9BACT|nr:hypothetical protein [Trichlorobacter thiogenes]SJZ49348.1 hypothetical protein SAMN02745119_00751 [Trichlorobacter thiogenes]